MDGRLKSEKRLAEYLSGDEKVTSMFTQSDLMQLVDRHDPPCVSLYMPTHAAGREQQQDEVRHKNLVQEAAEKLAEQSLSSSVRQSVLEKMESIPQDDRVWLHRSDGLAAFAAPDFFRCFTLPLAVPERTVVSQEFHISPLLPLLHANGRYFILALTKDAADLYEATRYTLVDCALPEFAPLKVNGEEQPLQYHSHRAPSQGKGEVSEAVYHGQGGPDDREKVDIKNFFQRQVEPEVHALVQGQRAPLVLACVDYLAPLYRDVNNYGHLLDAHVSGSPDQFSQQSLREQAWALVAPVLGAAEATAREKYGDLSDSDRTMTDPDEIGEAARQGRIETLFVPRPEANDIGASRADDPLAQQIDEAAKHTLLAGGEVLAVEDVPGGGPLAAVLRY